MVFCHSIHGFSSLHILLLVGGLSYRSGVDRYNTIKREKMSSFLFFLIFVIVASRVNGRFSSRPAIARDRPSRYGGRSGPITVGRGPVPRHAAT